MRELPKPPVYKAKYRAMIGERGPNTMIRNADLGLTGAYKAIIHEITWAPGIVVDRERAEKLCSVIKEGITTVSPALECPSATLVDLYCT